MSINTSSFEVFWGGFLDIYVNTLFWNISAVEELLYG